MSAIGTNQTLIWSSRSLVQQSHLPMEAAESRHECIHGTQSEISATVAATSTQHSAIGNQKCFQLVCNDPP